MIHLTNYKTVPHNQQSFETKHVFTTHQLWKSQIWFYNLISIQCEFNTENYFCDVNFTKENDSTTIKSSKTPAECFEKTFWLLGCFNVRNSLIPNILTKSNILLFQFTDLFFQIGIFLIKTQKFWIQISGKIIPSLKRSNMQS